MAELFKKNKAEIETYFAKQDLAGIVSELCLENLISNAEKYEINSTEPSKRAHTLTKILESKIVNNPDLFQNLKQFLGSFEDFSEREILTTVETASASDGELGINQDESTGKFVNESSQSETIGPVAAPMVQRWSDVVRCSRPASYSKSAREIAKVHFSRQKRPLERNAGKQVPYLRSTSLSHTSVGLHSVEPRQQRTRHQKAHTLAGYAYPTDTRRPRKKRSDTLSFGATEKYTTVSKTKSPAAKISKTKNQPSQHSEVYPGIDFSSHRSRAMVGHKGSTIRGEGVQLRIPPNAIKRGTSLDISLHGCISGPFSLPENTQLASPVFLVTCTPPYQFQREVTLTMHHFVQLQNREQCRDMVLLSSPQMKMEDEDFAYWKFSFCDQRLQCFPHTSYGEVELTHFSFLCFGIRLSRARPELRYRVSVHLPRRFISPSYSSIYCITISHDIYTENLKKYLDRTYPDHFFRCTTEVISSEDHGESVLLELPLKEAEQLGYSLRSDKEPCSIRKTAVNLPTMSRKDKKYARREIESYPPRIELEVITSEIGEVPFRPSTGPLHVKVTGIADQGSVCQGFNLPIFHRIRRVAHQDTDRPITDPSIQVAADSADPPAGGPGQPTMPELLHFQLADGSHISIPKQVGIHYRSFGTHLLQDSTGSHISALAEREGRNAENINTAILQEWLRGEGKTWDTLVSVLRKCGLGELASKIQQAKSQSSEAN